MRIFTDQLLIRCCGTLIGLGFIAIGAYSIFGGDEMLPELNRDRAFWFGFTAVLGGSIAVTVSWLVEDLSNIWCRPPRRWPWR